MDDDAKLRDDINKQLDDILSSPILKDLLNERYFYFLLKNNECTDEVYSDIQTLLKIEYPNPKNPFYQKTIQNQWKRRCRGDKCRNDIDKEISDIIELCYYFKHHEITDSFINNINDKFGRKEEKKVDPKSKKFSTKIISKGITQVKEERRELLQAIIDFVVVEYQTENPARIYMAAIAAFRLLKLSKPFTAYNDSMAYLMFKRIISSNDQDERGKILSFNIPIIKKIHKIDIAHLDFFEIHLKIYGVLLNLFKEKWDNPSFFDKDFYNSLDKNNTYSSKRKTKSKKEFAESVHNAETKWYQSDFLKTITNIVEENDLYNFIGTPKYKFDYFWEVNPERREPFERYLNLYMERQQISIEEFFRRAWALNFESGGEDGRANKKLHESVKILLHDNRDVFLQFLISISEASNKYPSYVSCAVNDDKLNMANKANPKKNKSVTANV